MNIAIVGIGNLLMSDEGAGVHAIDYLKEHVEFDGEVDLIDGGTMGLDLLPFIEGRDIAVFIDAVNFGREPGFVKRLEGDEISACFPGKLSVHQIALPDLLATLKLIENPPKAVILVGIQPERVDVGTELSGIVQGRLPVLIECIIDALSVRRVSCRIR